MATDHKHDLPLMANSRDFHLYHYVLDLTCDLEKKVFSGSIFLFLNPVRENSGNMQVFSIREYQEQMLKMRKANEQVRDHLEQSQKDIGVGNVVTDGIDDDGIAGVPTDSRVMDRHEISNSDDINVDAKRPRLDSCVDVHIPIELEGEHLHPRGTSVNQRLQNSTELESPESGDNIYRAVIDETGDENPAILVLDACDLEVKSVHQVDIHYHDLLKICRLSDDQCHGAGCVDAYSILYDAPRKSLNYLVEKWCIKVWKEGVNKYNNFPLVVEIRYSTKHEGTSLRWTSDQDNNPCVFTAAMWINNRAFFPTAEYGNLSTWLCKVTTQGGATVLMSSDTPGHHQEMDGPVRQSHFYHWCSSPLPPHTLAIAVGLWQHQVLADESPSQADDSCPTPTCMHETPCQVLYSSRGVLPCRVFGARSVVARAAHLLATYWPTCSRAAQELLGACPFPRVDLLIYPPCVQDMALSNAGLIFLSQSLLAEDGSMLARVGHELSHAWFGLFIGAKDWTEEWLSEGFATFVEDAIHAAAHGMSESEEVQRGELRALIRHKVLAAEMENTEDDLQTLRPDPAHEQRGEDPSILYVKNGLNPHKQFTQVHYLKGYFLLRNLSGMIGMRKFNTALRSYVEVYHGQLVLSTDVLDHVFKTFPELRERGLTPEKIYADWLDGPGMPTALTDLQPSRDNKLYKQVVDEVTKWRAVIASRAKKRSSRTKRKIQTTPFVQLEADQLVLLLEEMLAWPDAIQAPALRRLKDTYTLQSQNADVRHRWCELVVKHRYRPGYRDVSDFLYNDQAMGVYLYGELVLSRCPVQRALAVECFQRVSADLEEGTRATIRAMIYGETASS